MRKYIRRSRELYNTLDSCPKSNGGAGAGAADASVHSQQWSNLPPPLISAVADV